MAYINNLGQVRIGVRGWVAAQSGASASVTDSDATAFVTAAGITDSTQISALNTLVTDLKTYGLWTKMKAIYPFVGGSAASHKFNLKDPRDLDAAYRLVFNGGWVHSSNGALPNGTTGYADTKLTPSSTLSQNSTHISYYSRTNNSIDGIDFGANSSAFTHQLYAYIKSANGNTYFRINRSAGTLESFISIPDSRIFFMLNRTSSTQEILFTNTTKNTFNYNSTGLANNPIFIGAMNHTGTPLYYGSKESSFATIGDGLTDTEASNFYISVQKFQTTLGRHVGTPYVSDPDAIAFLMAAGITDGTQAAAINTLVIRMKADGVWTKMKAIYPFVGGTAASHKFNLKDPRDLDAAFRLVFIGGWTHTSNGAKGNGTTGYADTKLIPSSNYPTSYDMAFGFYSRTDIIENSNDISAYNTSSQCIGIDTRWSDGKIYGYIYRDAVPYNIVVPNSSSAGLISLTRTSTTMMKIFRDTSILGTTTTLMSGTVPTTSIKISGSAAGSYSTREKSFIYIGNGLSDAEINSLYSAVQAFQTTLGRQVNVPLVSDTDAQAFLNAANITSFQQASSVNKLVVDLKAAGVWTKMKAIYPFVGGSAASHKWNLKDPRDLDVAYRLVFNGGWTHTSTGAQPNGTTGYADTKLIPSSNLNLNSVHLSTYLRTNTTGNYADMGAISSIGSVYLQLLSKWSDNKFYAQMNDADFNDNTVADSLGLFIGNRSSSTSVKSFKNTTTITNKTTSSVSLPNNYIFLGGRTSTIGQLQNPSNREQAFASIGDGLTDTEATALYTAVQTYQTSLGRAVNTPIYNDGLVLNLDAGNANSYPGTGTTWFDLASGKNATLLNGPVYNSNNGGYLSLDGVNDRIDTTYTPGTFTNQTIIAWINKTNTQYCFILQKNSSPPFGFEIYPTTIYVCYGAFEAYVGYNTNGWHQVAYVYDGTQTGNSNRVKVYLNGVLQNLTFGSNPPSSITINDVMQVGWRPWASLYSAVGISTLQMYNTSLSATEILNNFNSTRGRFGL